MSSIHDRMDVLIGNITEVAQKKSHLGKTT
jgi:hypothetical protein